MLSIRQPVSLFKDAPIHAEVPHEIIYKSSFFLKDLSDAREHLRRCLEMSSGNEYYVADQKRMFPGEELSPLSLCLRENRPRVTIP